MSRRSETSNPPPGWMPHSPAAAIVTAACALLSMTVVFVTVLSEILSVHPPPRLPPEPSPIPPLSQHVLVLIPDALRYDFATDANMAPNFARHMRQDTHAVIWAGRVTMTSAAVMTMTAGQRGDFAQLITNLNVRRLSYNNVVQNIRDAGMTAGLAGDVTWAHSVGKFEPQVVDENGMAIDVDNSREILAAAKEMALGDHPPNLLVLHLIASDHQGHAYGMKSDRYAKFLRKFDEDVQAFLDTLPDIWTVLAFSDHGATDPGAHGTDMEVMRKTPLFAYGKGILRGFDAGEFEQVDIGHTIATLLGVPGPTHGVGTALTEILDIPPESAAAVGCADANRVERVARALGRDAVAAKLRSQSEVCRRPEAPAAERIAAARGTVRLFDQLDQKSSASSGLRNNAILAGSVLLMLLLPAFFLTRASPGPTWRPAVRFTLLAFFMSALCVGLTYQVERITPPFHNVIRAILFVLANGALAYGALRPSSGAAFYQRYPLLAIALLPGALICSYTANTPAESFVVLLLGGAIWLFASHADLRPIGNLFRGTKSLPWWRVGVAAAALGGLAPFVVDMENPTPRILANHPAWMLVVGLAAVSGFFLAGARERDGRFRPLDIALAIALSIGCVLARRVVPWPVGMAGIIVLPIAAGAALFRQRATLGFGLLFAGYAWVSRDLELLGVASGAALLEAVATAARPLVSPAHRSKIRFWAAATLTTIGFAATFLVRGSLQGGIDLTNIDYAVGSFGDPDVSQARVAFASGWKFATCMWLLLAAFLRPLSDDLRRAVAFGIVVVYGVRGATLAWMLLVCRDSYHTALRTLADVPSAIITTTAAAVALIVVHRFRSAAVPRQ